MRLVCRIVHANRARLLLQRHATANGLAVGLVQDHRWRRPGRCLEFPGDGGRHGFGRRQVLAHPFMPWSGLTALQVNGPLSPPVQRDPRGDLGDASQRVSDDL